MKRAEIAIFALDKERHYGHSDVAYSDDEGEYTLGLSMAYQQWLNLKKEDMFEATALRS